MVKGEGGRTTGRALAFISYQLNVPFNDNKLKASASRARGLSGNEGETVSSSRFICKAIPIHLSTEVLLVKWLLTCELRSNLVVYEKQLLPYKSMILQQLHQIKVIE